jgi:glycosyltransferase involved in cell wall biosynthesis
VKRRLRILHLLTNAFDPSWNWDDDPVSRLIWPASAIVRHTDRRRFELVIGTLRPPPAEAAGIPGLRLHALPITGPRGYPGAILQLARWLREQSIDVVQTHLFDATVVGLFAARLAGTLVTIATGHHSHEFAVSPRGLSFWLDSLCTARLAGHVIVPSPFMRETVADTYQMPRERIAVVRHGLDQRRLAASPDGRQRIRAELGLDGRLVVGAIGRLFWIKQYPHLLRAFAAAAQTRPKLALLIVGEGEQRAQLLGLARQLGVADRVTLLGLRGDVTSLLSAMDLFVHPALTESFGLVLIEAMAAGKPILSTAVGIAPEVVTEETGVLVSPSDPEALTRGLERLLSMRDQWEAMGRYAQHLAHQFTAVKMVAAYEAHAEEWLAASRAEPAPRPAA